MRSQELADALLNLAEKLSPDSRIIVAVMPPDVEGGAQVKEEEDEPTLDMRNVDHFDIADVIGEMGLWLAEMVAVSLHLDVEDAGEGEMPSAEKPS